MKTKLAADELGLIVPMNVEALCVDEKTDKQGAFVQAPYNFSRLPNSHNPTRPYLSKEVMTGGGKSIGVGVHLHWALPDGLTKGVSRQDGEGSVAFPETPDRWLITRTFSNPEAAGGPVNKIKSWVVESNYLSEKQPDINRPSLPVPYRTDDDKQQFRFLGRVLEYEAWLLKETQNEADTAAGYVDGLSAVGYGAPTFSASYSTSKNIFGFYDKDKELTKLGNDIMLSYHVVGWYSNIAKDPVNQLPLQFNKVDMARILEETSGEHRQVLQEFYKVLQEDGAFTLKKDLSGEDQLRLINALLSARFDFAGNLLNRCNWSLPAGTVKGDKEITHTLFTGLITDVKWNRNVSAFKTMDKQVSISVGNTASQALAALIAASGKPGEQESIELILDALQLDKLKGISQPGQLNRLEDLAIALHTSGYTSSAGGGIWEVTQIGENHETPGLKALAQTLGEDLNELNNLQLQYDKALNEIESARTQIFMDWYRFIQILRPDGKPVSDIAANELADFIEDQVKALEEKIKATNPDRIKAKAEAIAPKLPKDYELVKTSAARYWQPTEPVVLFKGNDITPPERYGGDGRFMADKTMLCRLSSQVLKSVVIPVGAIDNAKELILDENNMPQLARNIPLEYQHQIYALFTESCLLNPLVAGIASKVAGAKKDVKEIADIIKTDRNKFLIPALPGQLSADQAEEIKRLIGNANASFLLSFYQMEDNNYVLKTSEDKIAADDLKRLRYLLASASFRTDTYFTYTGNAPSMVYFVEWSGKNPWLPYSLQWNVSYFPIAPIKPSADKGTGYDSDFISKNFKLGDASYDYTGETLSSKVVQTYTNFIFLSPHAEENFKVQIKKFMEAQKSEKIDPYLKEVLEIIEKFPAILSQSISGFNNGMIMRDQKMQLQVKDMVEDPYQSLTNDLVKPTVGAMNSSAPSPSDYYNPIRAGFMRIESLTIVDVFGYTLNPKPESYSGMTVAQNLKPVQGEPRPIYLAPKIAQPSRLQFRWLSAANISVETNSHPATTPICGWILANHLQPGLWFYTVEGSPLGVLNLSEDLKKVIWQAVPGLGDPGATIEAFFNSAAGQNVNAELKKLALALYNDGDGTYLDDLLRVNDKAYSTIKPQSFKQTNSNAVLMGSPIAVAQVSLGIELKGWPAYSNGWNDLKQEVEEASARKKKGLLTRHVDRIENGFTKIKFPVRLGNMTQTDDGLLGYFTNNDYKLYHAVEAGGIRSEKVVKSKDNDIELSLHHSAGETVVTLLLDPRGSVHAKTGVLPAKVIDIPPVQFAEALDNLQIAFLTSPVLFNNDIPALPVPAQGGGNWNWVQRELNKWAEAQIVPVDDRARLSDVPQEIREGWLLLTNFNK